MRPSIERYLWWLGCCAIAVALIACAATAPTSGVRVETAPHVEVVRPAGGNVLSAAEIGAREALTAYDAIMSLRPRFLNARQSERLGRAPAVPHVMIEKGSPEPVEVLKSIRASDVAEIRYVEPWESTTKYGSEYTAGMIVVQLRALHNPTL